MTTRTIVPASDPRVTVTIEVPVEGKKNPLVFSAKRWEFQDKELMKGFRKWILDAKDPETNEYREGRSEDDLLIDYWIPALGQPKELLDLTVGERDQIWEMWRDESKLPLGESSAS